MKYENCLNKVYKYTFIFNNESYVADNCVANYNGSSYCEKKGITYENVEFMKEIIGCNDEKLKEKWDGKALINISYLIIFTYIFYLIIDCLFDKFIFAKKGDK